jgi:nucleotide-binding universal stress UspA family protein
VLKGYYAEESEKVFRPIRAFFAKQKIDADFVAKVGPAGDVIAALATQGKFDLIMMGSHGHGLLGNVVLGSVATKVMAKCDTPVLVIR